MTGTALLVIDAQQEYFAPTGKLPLPDGPRAVERIARVLDWARQERMPVYHIVHESRRPGATPSPPARPSSRSTRPRGRWRASR